MAWSAWRGRTRTTFRAGLALKVIGSFVNGLASFLAGASAIKQLMEGSEPPSLLLLAAGTGASFASGFGAIALVLRVARTRTLVGFVVYGAAMGVLVVALHLMGSLQR